MPLEVNLEISLGCESVAADVALVRPLAGVTSNVNLKGRVGPEDLPAVAAPVLEEGLPLFLVLLLADAEVGQVVGQKALTSIVKNALGTLLKKFQ